MPWYGLPSSAFQKGKALPELRTCLACKPHHNCKHFMQLPTREVAAQLLMCRCDDSLLHRDSLQAVDCARPESECCCGMQPSGPPEASFEAHAQAPLQTAGLVATDIFLFTCRHDDHQDNSDMEVDNAVYSYNSESSPQEPRHQSFGGLHRSDGLSNLWARTDHMLV